jgi:hypothetical protein
MENVKEICKAAINARKNAPLTFEGLYVKIYINSKGGLSWAVLSGSTVPFFGCNVLAQFEYDHPSYDSTEAAMKECDIEPTEENVRAWNWDNYYNSNDYENAIEWLIEKVETSLIMLQAPR